MVRLVKSFFWIVAPLGIFVFSCQLFTLLNSDFLLSKENLPAVCGFFAGAVLWLLFGRFLQFFHVLEHEFTHLLFGLLFFKKPKAISASDQGGRTELYGGNFLITLAPYFFPTVSFLLLAVFPLLDKKFHLAFCSVLGFFTGYHFISNLQEFKFSQPDIREAGVFFSPLFCLFGGLACLGVIFGFLVRGFSGSGLFFVDSYHLSLETGAFLYEAAKQLVLQWR